MKLNEIERLYRQMLWKLTEEKFHSKKFPGLQSKAKEGKYPLKINSNTNIKTNT